jgi:hypothetical protein
MVSAVGFSAASAGAQSPSRAASTGSSVAALAGRIRQAQVQLDDWKACVSAKTPKGQAAIQKLSGEISAAKEQIARALQAQSGTRSAATSASDPDAQNANARDGRTAPGRHGSVDIWA